MPVSVLLPSGPVSPELAPLELALLPPSLLQVLFLWKLKSLQNTRMEYELRHIKGLLIVPLNYCNAFDNVEHTLPSRGNNLLPLPLLEGLKVQLAQQEGDVCTTKLPGKLSLGVSWISSLMLCRSSFQGSQSFIWVRSKLRKAEQQTCAICQRCLGFSHVTNNIL